MPRTHTKPEVLRERSRVKSSKISLSRVGLSYGHRVKSKPLRDLPSTRDNVGLPGCKQETVTNIGSAGRAGGCWKETYETGVLRLSRVRARPDARMSVLRVCIVFHATAYASFPGSSLQAPPCECVASSSDCLQERCRRCRSMLLKTASSDSTGLALQPARVVSYPVVVLDKRKHSTIPFSACGPCIHREPSASQDQGPEAACGDAPCFIFNNCCGLAF